MALRALSAILFNGIAFNWISSKFLDIRLPAEICYELRSESELFLFSSNFIASGFCDLF